MDKEKYKRLLVKKFSHFVDCVLDNNIEKVSQYESQGQIYDDIIQMLRDIPNDVEYKNLMSIIMR